MKTCGFASIGADFNACHGIKNPNNPMQTMQTLIHQHVEKALTSSSAGGWQPHSIYDHDEQRHSLASIEEQLSALAAEAEPLVRVAVTGWGLTGKIPHNPGMGGYFTQLVLQHALESRKAAWPDELLGDGPPWPAFKIARFVSAVVDPWFSQECRRWASKVATEVFEIQESFWKTLHPSA